ncbi:MAG: hypothetical protein P1V18_05705 [Candidatus Gracilibacteria bacterium]|nr:hypothetical protein [Candidatus Gracilibacteria bacterium]
MNTEKDQENVGFSQLVIVLNSWIINGNTDVFSVGLKERWQSREEVPLDQRKIVSW